MKKCARCNEVEIPDILYYEALEQVRNNAERDRHCYVCWKWIVLERNKFVKCPYKIPIDRRVV